VSSRITTANVTGSFGDVFQSCAVNRRLVAKLMPSPMSRRRAVRVQPMIALRHE
jgi:hypothetical protein